MQLSLARWNHPGPTQGVWLVKQTPGVIIEKFRGQWIIRMVAHSNGKQGAWTDRNWGESWQLNPQAKAAKQVTQRPYPTRRAALDALQAALTSPSTSNLTQLIQCS